MNDLMTSSFLSYVELKKQAQLDRDLELGQDDLSRFFEEVEVIKGDMQQISHLLLDLQTLNQESKSAYSAKILRGLRDRIDSNIVAVLRKTNLVKTRLEALDKSIVGTAVDRIRVLTTNGLRTKLKEIMSEFQDLREKITSEYEEKRDDEGVQMDDIWRSLNKLHEVFLDMAVMVETQGEPVNDIQHNVVTAASFVNGGTNTLFYAKQMKNKKSRMWMCWVWAVAFIVILVCLVAMLTN